MSAVGTKLFSIVFTTFPNVAAARSFSKKILKEKLCACVQLLPAMESHYWWNGKIDKSSEILMLIKTHKSKVKKLQSMVSKHHPYDIPEFLEVEVRSGLPDYLKWIQNSLK